MSSKGINPSKLSKAPSGEDNQKEILNLKIRISDLEEEVKIKNLEIRQKELKRQEDLQNLSQK